MTVRIPAVVCRGLRYFRFDSRYLPQQSVPRTAAAAQTVAVPDPRQLKELQEPLQSARQTSNRYVHGVGSISDYCARQFSRVQAFGRWCQQTGRKISDVCAAISTACRQLQQALAFTGSGEAQAATPANQQAAKSSSYRYTWVNQRGDSILTEDPKLNPNHGGKPVWRRVEAK
jgi:hypothetical protein